MIIITSLILSISVLIPVLISTSLCPLIGSKNIRICFALSITLVGEEGRVVRKTQFNISIGTYSLLV